MSHDNPTDDTLAQDLIWGVGGRNGIAAYLRIKPRQVYYLIGEECCLSKS